MRSTSCWASVAIGVLLIASPISSARGSNAEPAAATPASLAAADSPVYLPETLPSELQQEFEHKSYKRDAKSGNYLSPKVYSKTPHEDLVPVLINGKYVKDLKGRTIFLRQSIRDRLQQADAEMFKKKQQHLVITYGFRSNALQQELFKKLSGHGKVAGAGGSFHETGMAVDLANWRDAQRFMIEAGFVGGCYGIEEDLVHYSIGELTKASNAAAFKRCTLKEIPENILKGLKKAGDVVTTGLFRRKKQ